MNSTHLHLVVNHLAIVGSILGGFVLIYAILVNSIQTKIAAYGIFVIAAIGATITFSTGESAEETVERMNGISEDMIERHEDSAGVALTALLTLGVASVLAIYLTVKKSLWTVTIAWITLLISLVSFALIARTGYIGGKIRHTELNTPTITEEPAAAQKGSNEAE